MNRQRFILLISICFISFQAYSQDTLVISKGDLIQKLYENNRQIKIANKQVEIANGDYHQSRALYLPTVTASHTAIVTNNPLMAFGSKLNQEILTASDFNPALLNNPDRTQNFATEIQVLQPLLNLDYAYQRQAARIQTEAYQLNAERTGEYLELEVNKAFMELQLAYEAVLVMEKAKKTSEEGLRLINDYFDQGLVQKTDVLAVSVRANEVENQLRYAHSNVRNASEYLALLLGEEKNDNLYKPTERAPENIQIEMFDTNLSEARKDMAAMDMTEDGYQIMMKSGKMSLLPRINAFGSYQLYDDQPLGFSASGYVVGAKLSWNIFDGYKSIGKTEKAKAEFEKSQLENEKYKAKEQVELNKAIRQLNDAQNKVALSKRALAQSSEAYQIRKNRFDEGLEKTTDLLNTETQLFQKELENRQAIFEYNFTKEYLRFLTR
jgi:outer membrane protein TolC